MVSVTRQVARLSIDINMRDLPIKGVSASFCLHAIRDCLTHLAYQIDAEAIKSLLHTSVTQDVPRNTFSMQH